MHGRGSWKRWSILLIAALLQTAGSNAAENWPGWRGPGGLGVYRGPELPLHWSPRQNVRWRANLPGTSGSSPVIWGEKVFLTVPVGQAASVMCLDRENGRTLWQTGVLHFDPSPAGRQPEASISSPPRCTATPVTDGYKVFALLGSALQCLDMEGNELWLEELDNEEPAEGVAASPVLVGENCVVHLLHPPRLECFDKRSGQRVWTRALTESIDSHGPDGGREWTQSLTPLLVQRGSMVEMVVSTPGWVRAFIPKTGDPLWKSGGWGLESLPRPYPADDLLVGFSGEGGATAVAVRRTQHAEGLEATVRWRSRQLGLPAGDGVTREGKAYFVNVRNEMVCVELKSGIELGRKQLPRSKAPSDAEMQLLLAGDRIYAPLATGNTIVIGAEPSLPLLATNSLEVAMSASLAAADGDLFLRAGKTIWRVSEAGRQPTPRKELP